RPRLDRVLGARSHPLVGPATWSVGKVSGGAAVNIIPEKCLIEVDRRLLPGESGPSALAEVDAIIAEIQAARPNLRIERECPFGYVGGMATSPSDPLVQALDAACATVRGESKLVGAAYGTNASKFAEVGVPCVVFGPGYIQQAHTADEFVDLDQVAAAVDI